MSKGKLIIGGVDIGNVGDISNRLKDALLSSDVIVVESIKRFNDKCADLNISINSIVLENDSTNEDNKDILQFITRCWYEDKAVLLTCSDGMPGICDPGHVIVRLALSLNIDISVVPGPSIVSTLPALTGFKYSSFIFQDSISSNRIVRQHELLNAKNSHRAFLFIIPNRIDGNELIPDIIDDIEHVYGSEIDLAIGVNITGENESLFVGKVDEAKSFVSLIDINHSSNVSFFIGGSV